MIVGVPRLAAVASGLSELCGIGVALGVAERYTIFAVPFDLCADLLFADLLAAVCRPVFASGHRA